MAKAANKQAAAAAPVEAVAKNWGVHVFIGLLAIAAGVLAISYPDITLRILGLIFGINLLVYGVFSLAVAFEPDVETVGRVLRAIVGIIALIVGLVLIVRPVASVLALLFAVAIWFIIAGVSDLVRGIGNGQWGAILLGLVGIAAGVILLADTQIGLTTLALLAGIAFIVRGIIEIGAGFEARKLAKG
ncbi:MAG: HdeD family acid-resistance protein [Solirubrobacterales bacterium]